MWADGEDGRPPSRWEHLASCAPSPGSFHPAPRRRTTRSWRRTAGVMQLRHQPAVDSAVTASRWRHLGRALGGRGSARAGATCSRTAGRDPGLIPHCHGQRGEARGRAHEKAARPGHRLREWVDAVLGIFDHQPQGVPGQVCPPTVKARVAVEAASTFGWERYVRRSGHVHRMKTFGASAPEGRLSGEVRLEPAGS